MSLKPSTPDRRRHQFPHDHLPPSRIPQPSPQLLRRSLSLRLRNTTLNILDNNATQSKSPTKSPFIQRRRSYCSKNQLHGSKSLTSLGITMAENNGHLNGKMDCVNGDASDTEIIKHSPTSVTVCCKQASKNCMGKSQHGMVSVHFELIFWLRKLIYTLHINLQSFRVLNFKGKISAKFNCQSFYIVFPSGLGVM